MHRRSFISASIAAVVGLATVGVAVTTAHAESRHWSHPEDPYGDPTADIRAYSLSLDATYVTASIALGEFDLASAQSSTFNVELDTNGDGVADFNIDKRDAATALVYPGPAYEAFDPVDCPAAQLTYNQAGKSLTFRAAVECIGRPSSVRASYYYSVSEGGDFAPAPDRFSPAVSNQPDGTASPAPSPTQPPPAGQRSTGRLAGTDRYSTAVAISRNVFPNGAPIVFLARADAFADALAGGTLSRGPILLVPQCGSVPEAVKAEVRRLGAGEVVALGGPGAVCDAVLNEVARA